jgi:hypothetical protein
LDRDLGFVAVPVTFPLREEVAQGFQVLRAHETKVRIDEERTDHKQGQKHDWCVDKEQAEEDTHSWDGTIWLADYKPRATEARLVDVQRG